MIIIQLKDSKMQLVYEQSPLAVINKNTEYGQANSDVFIKSCVVSDITDNQYNIDILSVMRECQKITSNWGSLNSILTLLETALSSSDPLYYIQSDINDVNTSLNEAWSQEEDVMLDALQYVYNTVNKSIAPTRGSERYATGRR